MSTFLTEVFKQSPAEQWEAPSDDKVSKLQTVLLDMQDESQATKLQKTDRESYKVNTELVAKRKDVQLRLEACKKATLEYDEKQEALKRIVTENEQFIRNTDLKIEKAERKIRDEKAEIARKDDEIEQLQNQLRELDEERERAEKTIADNEHIKHFLESTVKEYEEEFDGDVENLINRWKTLVSGNKELSDANNKLTSELDVQRDAWQKEHAKLQNECLVNNSSLHEYQLKLEHVRTEVAELESQLNSKVEEAQVKKSTVGIIENSIEQLFERAQDSCFIPSRRASMVEFVDSKYGKRLELVLSALTERIEELQWIHRNALVEINKIPKEASGEDNLDNFGEDEKVELILPQKQKSSYGTNLNSTIFEDYIGTSSSLNLPVDQLLKNSQLNLPQGSNAGLSAQVSKSVKR
eukprot:gene806-983_t